MKRVEKREANIKITPARVIEEKIKELNEKSLCRPPSCKMIYKKIS